MSNLAEAVAEAATDLIPVVVFDIDGTLADGKHRIHHITRPSGAGAEWRKDWDAYFSLLGADTLIRPVAEIAWALARAGIHIIYCTGRPGEHIPATQDWLRRHNLPLGDIHHRAAGDRRDDDVVKLELLKEIEARGYRILMVFDDRNRVVLAARGAGYTVAQVAEGDF